MKSENLNAHAFQVFNDCLKAYKKMDEKDIIGLEKYWKVKHFKKRHFIFSESDSQDVWGFIAHGSVKLIYEFGTDSQILSFLTEGSFYNMQKDPAAALFKYNAQATEALMIITIDRDGLTRLIEERPAFAGLFASLHENNVLFLQQRLLSLQLMDAQQRYEDLLNNFPELLNRFSLCDIANYLGMTPETLSRIRNLYLKRSPEKLIA